MLLGACPPKNASWPDQGERGTALVRGDRILARIGAYLDTWYTFFQKAARTRSE